METGDFDDLCRVHLYDWLEQAPRSRFGYGYRREAYRGMAERLGRTPSPPTIASTRASPWRPIDRRPSAICQYVHSPRTSGSTGFAGPACNPTRIVPLLTVGLVDRIRTGMADRSRSQSVPAKGGWPGSGRPGLRTRG